MVGVTRARAAGGRHATFAMTVTVPARAQWRSAFIVAPEQRLYHAGQRKGQKIPGVDQAWCRDVLTASIATFDATRPGCSHGNGTVVMAGGDDDAGVGAGRGSGRQLAVAAQTMP